MDPSDKESIERCPQSQRANHLEQGQVFLGLHEFLGLLGTLGQIELGHGADGQGNKGENKDGYDDIKNKDRNAPQTATTSDGTGLNLAPAISLDKGC